MFIWLTDIFAGWAYVMELQTIGKEQAGFCHGYAADFGPVAGVGLHLGDVVIDELLQVMGIDDGVFLGF